MRRRIHRTAYRDLKQDSLHVFAGDVVSRLIENPAYATVQAETTALAVQVEAYRASLLQARDGSTADTRRKDADKAALLERLNELAFALEKHSGGSELYLIGAGFALRAQTRRRALPAAEHISRFVAICTGRRGEIRCSIDCADRKAVRTYVLEYSTDEGATWHHAGYDDRRKFILSGLPHSPELWVRARAIGRRGKVSTWSEPALVPVV